MLAGVRGLGDGPADDGTLLSATAADCPLMYMSALAAIRRDPNSRVYLEHHLGQDRPLKPDLIVLATGYELWTDPETYCQGTLSSKGSRTPHWWLRVSAGLRPRFHRNIHRDVRVLGG